MCDGFIDSGVANPDNAGAYAIDSSHSIKLNGILSSSE